MDKWGVHLFWRLGMTPVDVCVYVAFTYQAAFDFAHTIPFERNKKRGWFVKQIGIKKIVRYGYYKKDNRHFYQEANEEEQAHDFDKEAWEGDMASPPPLELPAPTPIEPKQVPMWEEQGVDNPPLKTISIWKYSKPTKRRL